MPLFPILPLSSSTLPLQAKHRSRRADKSLLSVSWSWDQETRQRTPLGPVVAIQSIHKYRTITITHVFHFLKLYCPSSCSLSLVLGLSHPSRGYRPCTPALIDSVQCHYSRRYMSLSSQNSCLMDLNGITGIDSGNRSLHREGRHRRVEDLCTGRVSHDLATGYQIKTA